MISRRLVLFALPALWTSPAPGADWPHVLVAAARRQIGVTRAYDPAYRRIAYPMGDVDRAAGVCTDVVVRAYRDAFGLDLQRLVHEDMRRAFDRYPRIWALRAPDPNIDHRRVPNLATFLRRRGAQRVPAAPLQAGDLVTQLLPGNRPHIALVSSPVRVIHNIGAGTVEDEIAAYPVTGRYRWPPP